MQPIDYAAFSSLLLLPPATTPNLGQGRIFSHFTNVEGVTGITGIVGDKLEVGQQVIVSELRFGQGSNPFLANDPGDIFLTDLGFEATEGKLELIGIFGDKQKFVIQFSEETALLLNNIRVRPLRMSNNILNLGGSIYSIPGGTTLKGLCVVMRVRL